MAVDKHPTHIELPLRDAQMVSPNETEIGTPEAEFDRPVSPLHMSPGQIDGLDALKAQEYMNGRRGSSESSILHLRIPGMISPADVAFSAMHYLPYPVIVLDDSKTVVLANEATARLLSADDDENEANGENLQPAERYKGQTLAELGIDMIKDLRPVWVTWDSFLESLSDEINIHTDSQDTVTSEYGGEVTPTAERSETRSEIRNIEKKASMIHDAVVEVVITAGSLTASTFAGRTAKHMAGRHSYAKMIISIFEIEDQKYFMLTFTSTEAAQALSPITKEEGTTKIHNPKFRMGSSKAFHLSSSLPRSSASSASSERGSNHDSNQGSSGSSAITSPTNAPMSSSPFPPLGPPSRVNKSGAPSILQKVIILKDALLDNTEVPILAMWKDESVTIPNKAARRLFAREADMTNIKDGFDLVGKWHCYNHDFTIALDPSEYPISVLTRTQTPFASRLLGVYDPETGEKILYDCLGEAVRDPDTGEFLAGIVTCRDITAVTQQIAEIKEADEQRFQRICDSMPQLIWTATPDGLHDWFSQRWYDYTGLSVEESIGEGWKLPFHPEDMALTKKRWQHCLETGDSYTTEYRCRKHDGEWRWMLGRAVCLRNKDTGEIEKWFGTCTDIHETVISRFEAKRLRQQLLSVITHAQVTLFSVDRHRRINLLEGSFIWDLESEIGSSDESVAGSGKPKGDDYIGKNVYDVFTQSSHRKRHDMIPSSLQPIEDILTGKIMEDIQEHTIDNRWYRTKFVPVLGKKDGGGHVNEAFIDGVIGLSMDITEIKDRENDLQMQERENTRLLANEAAAKEASRLKSQFLANMSHEIRTPIAGVIGMAELLTDMNLDEEQQECAENIQRSANALLTVINDILDFSKVESGRLDIEEVQFSLSVVVRDVSKMLGFAAERKNLMFESNIAVGLNRDLIVMGDPGRVRQIITNLLTNSIKFTSEGRVKFSVIKEKEDADTIEVKFVVEDTGIGIEEEVRKRLFKPFSQADSSTARRFGGTGLGLTISKNLVDLMHGRITLESSLGQGTTASFWIPFNKPQYHDGNALIDIGSLPDRLQSEMSVSCGSSDYDTGSSPHKNSLEKPRHHRSISMTPPFMSEAEMSPTDRANIKILLVEDNAINQQIALKTIRKLGFSPFAVWNGKEALDYLLAAESPNPPHPKPDIILMDVQMPIIDGYRATHIIRHHSPYNHSTRNIPIVAMTASAIQGDREKCKKAGMDDYLAKPVKGKTLEKMLVRWAINRRVPKSETQEYDEEGSDCVEGDNDNCSRKRGKSKFDRRASTSTARHHSSKSMDKSEIQAPESPTDSYTTKRASQSQTFKLEIDPANKSKPSFDPARPPKDQTQSPLEVSRPAKNDRHHSHHFTLPQPENEGERAVRREVFEEKAKELRDEKLVGAASDEHGVGVVHGHGHGHGDRKSEVMAREEGQTKPQKLTVENVGRLERQENEEMEVAKKLELGGPLGSIQEGNVPGRNMSALRGDSTEVLGDTLMDNSSREDFTRARTNTPSSMLAERESESPGRIGVSDDENSREGNGNSEEKKENKDSNMVRPSVRRRWMDSQATIRGSAAGDP